MKTTLSLIVLALFSLVGCSVPVDASPPPASDCPHYTLTTDLSPPDQMGEQAIQIDFDSPTVVDAVALHVANDDRLRFSVSSDAVPVGFSLTWGNGIDRYVLSTNLTQQLRLVSARAPGAAGWLNDVTVECRK